MTRCPNGCCLYRVEGSRPRMSVTYNGHVYASLTEMADAIGMSKCTLRDRVTKQQCLAAPLQSKPWQYDGESVDHKQAGQIELCNRFLRARA